MKESKIFSKQNFSEKAHYVYRVTIDERYYIGKRSGLLNDLHTGRYKTSSKLVREKLKNGMTFSKIKILQVFSTSKEALEYESRILTRVNAKRNPKFLNQSNGNKDFCFKQHTEKSKKKLSEKSKAQFDENTEYGRKQREIQSEIQRNRWDENTELGRKRREVQSNKRKEYYNPDTEEGRRNLEKRSQISKSILDINTEEGRKRRENHSKVMKERFNPETEEGRRNKEKQSQLAKETSQKRTKTRVQNKKDASILGELMFNEAFIRENFLILDDKNNPRFLSPVYSKLSGYSESSIIEQKRIGKLSFLSGIKSIIKISEEFKNTKIQEIKAIIKSRNEKELSI